MAMVLNIDAVELATIIINNENFVKKELNTIEHLRAQFGQIQSDSPKVREFRQQMEKELTDIEENIVPRLKATQAVTEEFKSELEKLENSDEIFAQARASFQESDRQAKTKLSR